MVHFVLHFFPLYHRMPPCLVQQIPEKQQYLKRYLRHTGVVITDGCLKKWHLSAEHK